MTRRNRLKKESGVSFSTFQEGGAEIERYLKEYVGPTMKRMWAKHMERFGQEDYTV
jgi:hypothetical protein